MHTAAVTDFRHSAQIWRDFPELVPGIVLADGRAACVQHRMGVGGHEPV
jgi:hypothetical protein